MPRLTSRTSSDVQPKWRIVANESGSFSLYFSRLNWRGREVWDFAGAQATLDNARTHVIAEEARRKQLAQGRRTVATGTFAYTVDGRTS